MELQTKRLILREYILEDWEAVHRYHSDPVAVQFESWGPHTIVETKAFIREAMNRAVEKKRKRIELAACLQTNGRLIGGCGLRLGETKKGFATLGYIFDRTVWGNGFATEAAAAMIEAARNLEDVHTIHATCDSRNIASQRVLEKLGLEAVGMVAELEMVKGHFRDMVQYELLL